LYLLELKLKLGFNFMPIYSKFCV